jgi:hypothetical protein
LLQAIGQADRLVLLGDVVELRQRPVVRVLQAARETLELIGAALAPGRPLLLLAGNHDHGLVAPGLALRDPDEPLALDGTLAPAGALAQVVEWLGAGRTEVRYPGVWLREDVWATHGHYADRHTTVPMLERVGAGAMARVAREAPGGPERVEDYESVLAPIYAWLDALGATARGDGRSAGGVSAKAWRSLSGRGRRGLRARALGAGFPVLVAALNRAGIGPLSAQLSGDALRRGPLEAMGEVIRRLNVQAAHVIFGHTHRAGPLPDNDTGQWHTPSGTRLTNTGCWVHDRMPGSPYRPGFAVWVDDAVGTSPRLVNLLD